MLRFFFNSVKYDDMKDIIAVKKTGRWFVGGDNLTGALHVL